MLRKYILAIAMLALSACGSVDRQLVAEIQMPEAPEILNRAPAPLKTIRSQYPEQPAAPQDPNSPLVAPIVVGEQPK